jgi:hypothetical protein
VKKEESRYEIGSSRTTTTPLLAISYGWYDSYINIQVQLLTFHLSNHVCHAVMDKSLFHYPPSKIPDIGS